MNFGARPGMMEPYVLAAGVKPDDDDEDDESPGLFWASVNFTMKLLFLVCILLQALLWPSIMTIAVIALLAVETILKLVLGSQKSFVASLTNYGVFFLRGGKPKPGLYLYSGAFMVYTLIFFILYSTQQIHEMPYMTSWIHPDYSHNYSFTESQNNEFQGMNVRSDASKFMRDHTFSWPRELKVKGMRINGTLKYSGPAGSPLVCSATDPKFSCFAANLVSQSSSPFNTRAITPIPSLFYTTDIMVTPPAGVACNKLEIYRAVYGGELNLEYGLEYPASSPPSSVVQTNPKCNLFGTANWCLVYDHPFTEAQYQATIDSKCKADGSIVFRLPPRAVDIEPETGRMGLDAMIVTAGASVSFKYTWHDRFKKTPMLDNWKQWSNTVDDGVQPWRDSIEGWPVFCRYAIAITPFLMLWYYMTVHFEQMLKDTPTRQILMHCIFVLLPASVLFFVVGAWIPLAGCIACALALNHSTNIAPIRIILLFITLACNLTQFIYVMYIIGSAGSSAFMYEDSLRQIQEQISGLAFVSGSPTWIALAMPTTIAVNAGFSLGVLTCLVYESYVWINGAASRTSMLRSDARAGEFPST